MPKRRYRISRAARRAAAKARRKIRRRRSIAAFVSAGKSTGVISKKTFLLVENPDRITTTAEGTPATNTVWSQRTGVIRQGFAETDSNGTNGVVHMPTTQDGQRFSATFAWTDPKIPPHVPTRWYPTNELAWTTSVFPMPHFRQSATSHQYGGVVGDTIKLCNLSVSGTIGYRNVVAQAYERFEVQWFRMVILRCEWNKDPVSRTGTGYNSTDFTNWMKQIRENLPDPLQTANRPYSRCPLGNSPSLRLKHPRFNLNVDSNDFRISVVKDKRFYVKDGTIEDVDRVPFRISCRVDELLRDSRIKTDEVTDVGGRFLPDLKHWYCLAMCSSVNSAPYTTSKENVESGFFLESLRQSATYLDA